MEPITLTAAAIAALSPPALITSMIGGWIGNRTDRNLCQVYDLVRDQFLNPDTPTNHDIQRAVRGACLRATLIVCQRLIAGKTNVVERWLLFPSADIAGVVRYLRQQLTQLPNARFDIPTEAVSAQYELLLEPRGQTATQRIPELIGQLRTLILDELTANNLRVEADLQAAILTGLPDGTQRVDWYELVCAFFAEELKTNARLSTIVETNLLREVKALTTALAAQVPDVTWPDDLLTRQAEQLGQAMAPLAAQFAELMTRLDEMLALLIKLEADIEEVKTGVGRVQETVEAGIAQILKEVGGASPPAPVRPKFLNAFARYDSARLIGREPELADIADRLARQRVLLVRGMGGSGKTTLAKAYLDRSQDQYEHLAYVEIVGNIADSMLRALGRPKPDTRQTPDERFAALLDELRAMPKLLLVLDNVQDADAAADLRARKADLESLQAQILITGRVRMAEFVQTDQLLELGALALVDARALFVRTLGRTVRPTETAVVDSILEKTFRHAKLIEVVATQLSRNLLLSLTEAHDMVAKRQFDHDELNLPDDLDPQAQTIQRILLNLFDTDPLADELQQLLRYFAVLPAIDIPAMDLVKLLGLTTPADRNKLTTNLLKLAHTAWLDQIDGAFFSIHGLVQWVVRERLQPTLVNCNDLISGTAGLIYDLLKSNPLNAQPYVGYGDALLNFFVEDDNGPLTALCNNLAGIYGALGDNQQALAYDLKALSIREQTLPPTHPDLTTSYANIALTFGALGDNQQALAYNLKALGIREQTLPPTHPDLAKSYNNIAGTYNALGDNQQALDYNLKALSIYEQTLPPTHPDLARSYSNLAGTYNALGDNQQALDYNLKALSIYEQTLPPTHPDLANSYNNIAITYFHVGDLDKALDFMQRAVAIRERVLPPTHPNLLDSRESLAIIEEHAIRKKEQENELIESLARELREVMAAEQAIQEQGAGGGWMKKCAKFFGRVLRW